MFSELEPHAARLRGTTLRELFDADPDRAERLSVPAGELELDFSKNLLDDAAVEALVALARERGLPERIEAIREALLTLSENPKPSLNDIWDVDDMLHGEIADAAGNALMAALIRDLAERTVV